MTHHESKAESSESRLQELELLVMKICDSELTDSENDRLQELVTSDPACCKFYAAAICIHAALPQYCGAESGDVRLFQSIKDVEADDSSDDSFKGNPPGLPGSASGSDHSLDTQTGVPGPNPPFPQGLFGSSISYFGKIRLARTIAMLLALLLITVVTASENVRTIIAEILLPSQFSITAKSGSARSSNEGMLLTGPSFAPGTRRIDSSLDERLLLTGPNFETGTRRIGSSLYEGVALANLFAFPLPDMADADQVHSARLEWTLTAKDANPDFDVDLYGLGYTSQSELPGQGFWEGEFDTSLRKDYGMAGGGIRPVRLIQASVMAPDSTPGRIQVEGDALVAFLQSLYDDGAKVGDLVVFRLNSHESTLGKPRVMGYSVVHPPMVPDLTEPADFPMFWITAKRDVGLNEYAHVHRSFSAQSMVARPTSGLIRSNHDLILPESNADGFRTIGSASSEGQALAAALLFTLPPVEEFKDLEVASLRWSVDAVVGKPGFSVDLYGLGYSATGKYSESCFWEGERDTASPADYQLLGSPNREVALIAKGVMAPDTEPGQVTIEGKSLVRFLRSLYEDGAQRGDTVVFRLSADQSTRQLKGLHGYRIVLPPGRTDVTLTQLPVLCITAK